MELLYEHYLITTLIYDAICLAIIQWYVAYPLAETKKRREQMRDICRKIYNRYYN